MKTLKLKPNSNKPNNKTLPAFTIIEVVLVLAIAGLIFLMVFIALPALQRNQRDTQRKNDMSRVKTALDNYKANNRGKIPSANYFGAGGTVSGEDSDFAKTYLNSLEGEFNDPSGSQYMMGGDANRPDGYTANQPFDKHIVYYSIGAKCNGEALEKTNASNDYAIQLVLEGGGVYCVNN